jgi:hypothetical protein
MTIQSTLKFYNDNSISLSQLSYTHDIFTKASNITKASNTQAKDKTYYKGGWVEEGQVDIG